MEIFNIQSIFYWWLMIFVVGIIFLPLTNYAFKSFLDKGYIFSKILSIAIISYIIFFLGTIKFLLFDRANIILIIAFSLLTNYLFLLKKTKKYKRHFLIFLKNNWRIFLIEELIFIGIFLFWSYIKMFQSDINGLEKFMDFGIINSILRTDYFPAKDIWFSSFPINYYYFGHLVTATLTKASNISSNITFNLMQALIVALCFSASFSIGANLYYFFKKTIAKKISYLRLFISGLLTAILVTFSGNLHTIYAFFKAYVNENPVPPWQLKFLLYSFPNQYWYPNATRFIHNTIHEFPMYSWVVSDLHGHVLDIPFVLLVIALAISMLVGKRINYLLILFSSFLISVLYMTNAWDGAIYLGLLIILIFFAKTKNEDSLIKYISYPLLLILGYFIFSLPFNLFFKPFVSGVGVLCSPEFLINKGQLGPFLFEESHCQKSPIWQLFILYGFFYFWAISFLVFLFINLKKNINKITQVDKFIFILIIFSTFLILIPEFLYIKDIYPDHYRANTMFKLAYQTFILLSICSGFIIVRIFPLLKRSFKKLSRKIFITIYFSFSLIIISICLIYPSLSINSYYDELKDIKGLDGTKYLKNLYKDDYQAIIWIEKNIKKQPIILEAQGDSYTNFARISANTGLPTVLGWTVHEWLWRGTYNILEPRIKDIKFLYETKDLEKTKELIDKYDISLIFIGSLEKEKYENLNEEKFKNLGKIIFKNNEAKIYQLY